MRRILYAAVAAIILLTSCDPEPLKVVVKDPAFPEYTLKIAPTSDLSKMSQIDSIVKLELGKEYILSLSKSEEIDEFIIDIANQKVVSVEDKGDVFFLSALKSGQTKMIITIVDEDELIYTLEHKLVVLNKDNSGNRDGWRNENIDIEL